MKIAFILFGWSWPAWRCLSTLQSFLWFTLSSLLITWASYGVFVQSKSSSPLFLAVSFLPRGSKHSSDKHKAIVLNLRRALNSPFVCKKRKLMWARWDSNNSSDSSLLDYLSFGSVLGSLPSLLPTQIGFSPSQKLSEEAKTIFKQIQRRGFLCTQRLSFMCRPAVNSLWHKTSLSSFTPSFISQQPLLPPTLTTWNPLSLFFFFLCGLQVCSQPCSQTEAFCNWSSHGRSAQRR